MSLARCGMTNGVPIAFEGVFVREDRLEVFLRITKMLFNRRHVLSLGQWDQLFQLPELVAMLRDASEAYRAHSTEQTGPIPVPLGYLDVRGRALVCVASPWPADAPIELMVAMLREWVEPQGSLHFGDRVFTFSDPAKG